MIFTSESDVSYDDSRQTIEEIKSEVELEPKPTPLTKKRKLAQYSSIITQLKDLSETVNPTVDDNEFEVFGKHVGLQLKSLPLLLALEAQEHIQLYINTIRRHHFQNASELQRITNRSGTLLSSYYSQDSSYGNTSQSD